MSHGRLGADSAPKIYFAAVLGGMFLSIAVSFLKGDAYIFLSYALPQICYFVAIFAYLKFYKIPVGVAIPLRKPVNPIALLLALVVTAGIYCQNLLLAVSFQWLMQAIGIEASIILPDFTKAINLILGLIIICVFPALSEELMFRGAALNSFKGKGGVAAVLLSAAFFSLSHGNLSQLVHQFILGIVLAYLTLQTGNIIYAMVIHFTNNLLAITLPLAIPAYNSLAVCSPTNALIMLGLSVVGIFILYPSIRLLIKTAGCGKKSMISFFMKKESAPCYNSITEDGKNIVPDNPTAKIWLTALFAFLAVQILVNTLINAIPFIKGLLS